MNYRHEFHAGNFADVMKHTLLVSLLRALNRKPTAWRYFDTHAGAGCYDLHSKAAMTTGEALDGIGRLWPQRSSAPEPVRQLCDIITESNRDSPAESPRYYPGSACLAAALARPQDRLVLAELHPQEQRLLKERLQADARIALHARDGYEMLKALVPPAERRGLVFIDPPFEQPDEFKTLFETLREAYARWPMGVYAVWYPIKEQAAVRGFYRKLTASGMSRLLLAELYAAPVAAGLFSACGMLVVNPPWQTDEVIQGALRYLAEALAPGTGHSRVQWLVPEKRHKE